MSYEVLTLKYRPKTFDDLVGQRTVAETLQRAVSSGRVANAYLFCGSRGVGKTSSARILAKALNCPVGEPGVPCNTCEICKAISHGEDLDVIEIDGASNRGIDDVRGIRDNAGYVPSRSAYKIYIIDEVHMLTVPAFNALLKVLEEPPPHVKFIFATTDPNNLPDTILSRCQRHEFRRISVEDIVERLRHICTLENIETDDEVLRTLATRSEGGLRDSLSALDQAVSYAGSRVVMEDLEHAIGLLPAQRVDAVLSALIEGRVPDLVGELEGAFWAGFDPHELLEALAAKLREFMLFLAAPETHGDSPARAFFDSHARALPLDRALYVLRLMLNAAGDMKRNGHERVLLEMACIKAARSTGMLPVEDILGRLGGTPTEGGAAPPSPSPSGAASAGGSAAPRAAAPVTPPPASSPAPARESAPPAAPRWTPPDARGARGGGSGGPRASAAPPPPPQAQAQAQAAPAPAPPRQTAPAAPAPAPRGGAATTAPPAETRPAPPRRAPARGDEAAAEMAAMEAAAAAMPSAPPMAPPEAAREIPASAPPSGPLSLAMVTGAWSDIIEALRGESGPLGASLAQAKPIDVEGERVIIEVPAGKSFVLDRLSSGAFEKAFGAATQRVMSRPVGTRIREGAPLPEGEVPRKNVYEDPAVQKFIQHFDGGISNVEFGDG